MSNLTEALADAEYLFEKAPTRFKNEYLGDWNSLLVRLADAVRAEVAV